MLLLKKDVFHGFSECVQVSLLFFSKVTVYTFSTGFFTDLPHTLFLFEAGTRTFLGSFFSELVFCFREGVVFSKVQRFQLEKSFLEGRGYSLRPNFNCFLEGILVTFWIKYAQILLLFRGR